MLLVMATCLIEGPERFIASLSRFLGERVAR
jgi:hypothetical protein